MLIRLVVQVFATVAAASWIRQVAGICLTIPLFWVTFIKQPIGHTPVYQSLYNTYLMNNGKTCFLIDDDIDDQEIFALVLKSINPSITCITANDGIEAVTKLTGEETFNPDYIFLDLNMPRMDGKQCLQEIRKISRLNGTPVIIYSTSSNQRDILETRALGANDYLEKQSSMTELKNKLAHFFK